MQLLLLPRLLPPLPIHFLSTTVPFLLLEHSSFPLRENTLTHILTRIVFFVRKIETEKNYVTTKNNNKKTTHNTKQPVHVGGIVLLLITNTSQIKTQMNPPESWISIKFHEIARSCMKKDLQTCQNARQHTFNSRMFRLEHDVFDVVTPMDTTIVGVCESVYGNFLREQLVHL